jgi:hypothetical protein
MGGLLDRRDHVTADVAFVAGPVANGLALRGVSWLEAVDL